MNKQQQILRAASTTTLAGCTSSYYQIHDAKLICLLTQHAQWSRNKKPFLLCKCDKGEGARNKDHICSLVSDTEQVLLYNKAETKWNKNKMNPKYTEEEHHLWIAENNDGFLKKI